jgi:DNA-directed RNA polymerase specialized sigma24 family protein
MAAHRLTDEQEQAVIARYVAGESTGALGTEYGVSHQAICNILRRNKVQPRTIAMGHLLRRKLNPQQEAELCQRYIAAPGIEKLAAEFGLNKVTLYNILRRNGIELQGHRRDVA